MITFLASNAVALTFFLVLAVVAVQGRSIVLFFVNLAGLVSAAFSITLELSGIQSKNLFLLLLGIILASLIFDLASFLVRIRGEAKSRYDNPETWRQVMKNREYKMVFHEDAFNSEVERQDGFKMTEKLQALQMWRMGNKCFLQGKLEEAQEKYDLSIKWLPNSVTWIDKSGIFFETGNYDEVLTCCEKAFKLNPGRDEAWLNRGLAFMALQKYDNALKSFEEALAVNANKPETHTHRGNALRKLGSVEQSQKCYERAIQLAPEFREAWFQKGIALSIVDQLEEAAECFRQTIALNKSFSPGNYHLANTLNKLDWNEEAIRYYRKALRQRPNFHEAWNNLGIAQSKLGKLKSAIASYKRAVAINPEYQEAWLNQALCYETLKKYEKAIRAYQQFLDIAPVSFGKHREIAQQHMNELKEKLKNGATPKQKKVQKKPKLKKKDQKGESKAKEAKPEPEVERVDSK